MNAKIEDEAYQSLLLFNVIISSEMWEIPSPSVETIDTGIYTSTELYCTYQGEIQGLQKFQTGKYDANPIIYDHDEYWNKSTVIPTQASVLLLSSRLDGQTTHKYAEYLLDALQGDNKEFITFEHAIHGTILSTPLNPGESGSPICGMELLISYIKSG